MHGSQKATLDPLGKRGFRRLDQAKCPSTPNGERRVRAAPRISLATLRCATRRATKATSPAQPSNASGRARYNNGPQAGKATATRWRRRCMYPALVIALKGSLGAAVTPTSTRPRRRARARPSSTCACASCAPWWCAGCAPIPLARKPAGDFPCIDPPLARLQHLERRQARANAHAPKRAPARARACAWRARTALLPTRSESAHTLADRSPHRKSACACVPNRLCAQECARLRAQVCARLCGARAPACAELTRANATTTSRLHVPRCPSPI